MGISPASLMLPGCMNSSQSSSTANGLVNSLRLMLYNDNYAKPNKSNKYILVIVLIFLKIIAVFSLYCS